MTEGSSLHRPVRAAVMSAERVVFETFDGRNPSIDKVGVEVAITEYLDLLWIARRPLHWFDDARSAHAYLFPRRLHRAYWPLGDVDDAALQAAWTWARPGASVRSSRLERRPAAGPQFGTAWSRSVRATFAHYFGKLPNDAGDAGWKLPERFAHLMKRLDGRPTDVFSFLNANAEAAAPMLKAFAAGLFYLRINRDAVICVPRPSIWRAGSRLHREDGPAVEWPTGEGYHFLQGVHVPDWVVERPEEISLLSIRTESNAEHRRIMIERFGIERFVRQARARLVGQDQSGQLWRIDLPTDGPHAEPYAVLEVENGTLECDGTRRRYFLRVPPSMRSPHEAVAWTYGLTAAQYQLAVRT